MVCEGALADDPGLLACRRIEATFARHYPHCEAFHLTSEAENLNSIGLHPDFPRQVWVVVEQPRNELYRIEYNPADQTFTRTRFKSLIYDRGFSGVYGWIGGSGTPPGLHYDVLLLTRHNPGPGEIFLGYICGLSLRHDGHHKFLAMDTELRREVAMADLAALSASTHDELMRLYPAVHEGEGWLGAEVAFFHLQNLKPTHD